MTARPLPLRERLRGSVNGSSHGARPLLLGPSPVDVFTGGSSALVEALRRAADEVIGVQRRIVDAGAELLVAPTAGTTAPALHQSGQAYRAAALTAAAVDLTRDAAFAARTHASVIGEVVASSTSRGRAEARTHVERLATSAIDAVLIVGDDPEGVLDVVRAAAAHGLPALIQLAIVRGTSANEDPIGMLERAGVLGVLAGTAERAAGATPLVVVITADDVDVAYEAIERLRAQHPHLPLGARLALAPNGGDEGERVQLAAATAWGALAACGLSVLGLRGPTALQALPVLADLVTAERASLPGPPTIRQA